MSQTHEVSSFRFRGNREYLHSTTVFDHLAPRDPDPKQIDFTFHKLTTSQCRIEPERSKARESELVASYTSHGGGMYLYEADVPIQEREEYDEHGIVASVTIDGSSALFLLPMGNGATFAETAIAAYKALLQRIHPADARKLLFARMKLSHIPASGECRVTHRRSLGTDFLEAAVWHNNASIGTIFFRAQ